MATPHAAFPGQASEPSCSCHPSCTCGYTGSPAHCAGLGVEPVSQHSQDTARSCCATEGTPIKFFNKRSAGLCQPFLYSSLLFFFYYWFKTRGTGRSLVGRSGGFLQVKSIRFTEAPETQRCQDQVWRSSANLGSLPGQDPVGFEPAEEASGGNLRPCRECPSACCVSPRLRPVGWERSRLPLPPLRALFPTRRMVAREVLSRRVGLLARRP